MSEKQDLKDLSLNELEDLIAAFGLKPYRAKQIFKWLFQKHAHSVDSMTDLSKDIRKKLSKNSYVGHLTLKRTDQSKDNSKKFLFETSDNNGIESVLIPERNHCTLCISTQIGCPMKCGFCYTGEKGLLRNLSASEILNQVGAVLKTGEFEDKLPNIVFMGMGEPLSNYDNTVKSIQTLLSPWGFNFSHRKVTVSTAGLVPQMNQLAKDLPVNLAISLNAPNNKIRNRLMPINKKFPIEELINTAKNYPLSKRKRITFEYILIKDINDSDENAHELAEILKGFPCKINLIPFNEHPATTFKQPDEDRITKFRAILLKKKFTAPIRRSKGSDIAAACGQLGKSIG